MLKLQDVINGIKVGHKYKNQYFALAVRTNDAPTVEVLINHYAVIDEKIEYINSAYNEDCKHKFANVIIEDFAVGKDFDDIQIALGLKEVGF